MVENPVLLKSRSDPEACILVQIEFVLEAGSPAFNAVSATLKSSNVEVSLFHLQHLERSIRSLLPLDIATFTASTDTSKCSI